DLTFPFAGKGLDGPVDELRARAGDNVHLTGWLSDEDLHATYRRAAVYVQASRHEGFGLAVAGAVLGGGGAGGIRRPPELGPDAARRARERILTEFPMERRLEGILQVVEDALGS